MVDIWLSLVFLFYSKGQIGKVIVGVVAVVYVAMKIKGEIQ